MPRVTHYKDCRGGWRPDGWVDEEWKGEFCHYKNQVIAPPVFGLPKTISYKFVCTFGLHGQPLPIERCAYLWWVVHNATCTTFEEAPTELIESAVLAYIVEHDLPGDIQTILNYVRHRISKDRKCSTPKR